MRLAMFAACDAVANASASSAGNSDFSARNSSNSLMRTCDGAGQHVAGWMRRGAERSALPACMPIQVKHHMPIQVKHHMMRLKLGWLDVCQAGIGVAVALAMASGSSEGMRDAPSLARHAQGHPWCSPA